MKRIHVTKEEMIEIITNNTVVHEEAADLLQHIYEHGFLFNEYTLIWENTYTYKVKIEGLLENQIIHVKKIYEVNGGGHLHKNFDFQLTDYLENIAKFLLEYKGTKKYTREMIDNTWSADYMPVVSFMQYALHAALNRDVIYKEKTDRVYKKYNTKKYKEKTDYKLIDVIRIYSEHINHRKHVITCPRWEVSGHPRHLKSGKVTWVSPYPKGKDRNKKPVDRDYHL